MKTIICVVKKKLNEKNDNPKYSGYDPARDNKVSDTKSNEIDDLD